MRLTKLRHKLWAALAVSVSALLAVGPPSVYACALDDAQAYQASSQEVSLAMEQTALSQLGDGYPTFPQLEMGYPDATSLVSAPAPCLLLKAIGYTEGMWEQAWGSVPVGASGPTKQSASCGYGIMQITSGMRNPNEIPLETQLRIAGDYRFNIAWGTNILAEKWNTGDLLDAVVGDRDLQWRSTGTTRCGRITSSISRTTPITRTILGRGPSTMAHRAGWTIRTRR